MANPQDQPDLKNHALRKWGYLAPLQLFLLTILCVFVGEGAIMLFLALLPTFDTLVEALIDSFLLSLLLFPFLYFLMYRPMRREMLELQNAIEQIKHLEGIIPICMHCKNIRTDQQAWQQIEGYFQDHSNAQFSHIVCPDCLEEHYSEYEAEIKRDYLGIKQAGPGESETGGISIPLLTATNKPSSLQPYPIKRNYLPYLSALAVFAFVALTTMTLYQNDIRRFQVEEHSRVDTLLSARQVALESGLSRRLNVAYSMAAFAAQNPAEFEDELEGNPKGFEEFARFLDGHTPNIRSIQLAPNAIVNYIFPLKGNEEAIGHDLLNDPNRRVDVLRTIERADLTLAGPLILKQGGQALIGRVPIFVEQAPWQPVIQTEHGQFWGLGVVLVDIPPLLLEAGLVEDDDETAYAVRAVNAEGNPHAAFFGDDLLFSLESTRRVIVLPDGAWELAARPVLGWGAETRMSKAILVFGSILAIILALATYIVVSAPARLQKLVWERTSELTLANLELDNEITERKLAVMALQKSEAEYYDLYNNSPDMYVAVDAATGRIIKCNQTLQTELGYTKNEIIGRKIFEVYQDSCFRIVV